jgi:hypothetical protein
MKILRRAMGAAFVVGLLALPTAPATAYTHTWQCYVGPYTQCRDYSGQYLNPWHYGDVFDYTNGSYCAKGSTNVGGGGTTIVFGCMSGIYGAAGTNCTSLYTQAYGYGDTSSTEYDGGNTSGGC